MQLLDAVVALPGALSAADTAAARAARALAWAWMLEYPLENGNWCGYCEDLTLAGLRWIDGECEYDSMLYGWTARYLMGVPSAGGVVPPNTAR